MGEKAALGLENAGDSRGAALTRLRAANIIGDEEIARKMREAGTPEEKRLAGILKENWAVEKQSKLLETLTGGVQAFYDRLKARKDEAVKGWEEQVQAARSYYDELRSRLTVGTMDQVWRQQLESGLRASVRAPEIPPPPSQAISQADVQAVFKEMEQDGKGQLSELQMIRLALERLAGVPGWGMQGA